MAPEELGRLFDAARTSARTFRGLSGADRHALYLAAAATGFRVSELASMTPESFALAGAAPTATVEASCTKNRKLAVQPLPLDVAASLRPWLTGKAPAEKVWPGTWSKKRAAMMIRADLKEARATWLGGFLDARQRDEMDKSDFLAYCDAEGRYADFHALRHSFITMVGKAGVSPREHQDLARHSTYALTSRYSHSRFYDLAAAVQTLPIPTGTPGTDALTLAANGTDGRQISLGPFLGPRPAKTADFGEQSRTETATDGSGVDAGKTKESLSFPTRDASDRETPREEHSS
jgi:integrase